MSRPTSSPVRLPTASLSCEDFRLLVESVVDYAIFMLDAEGRVSTWNLGAERIKGYRADEIVGQHFSRFYPPEEVAAGKPALLLKRAHDEGHAEEEGWRVRKDGSRFWANVVLTALRDKRGVLRGYGKVARDLTERKKAEQTAQELVREHTARTLAEEMEARVRESEARYKELNRRLRLVLEGIEDGIAVQDRSGRIIFANTAGARICGASSVDELLNASNDEVVDRFEILDEEDRPISSEVFPGRRALKGEETTPTLMQVRERATGHRSWRLVRAMPMIGEDGTPELALNIVRDVTASRRKETIEKHVVAATAALSSSLDMDELLSAFARALVPNLADWCSISLLEGDRLRNVALAHADPAKIAKAREMLSKYPEPSARRDVWNVVRSGRSDLFTEINDETLKATAVDEEHLQALREVGLRSAMIVPIRVWDGIVGVLTMVVGAESDRRYVAEDLAVADELGRRAGTAIENARLYAAAQEAAKRAEDASRAKDEFLATVSHELRTPLNAIVGWATLIKDRVKDPSVAKPIEVIHRNALAQVKIIEDILDVSRVITGKFRVEPRPADLVAITRDAIEVVRPPAAAKRIEIEFVPQDELCLLVADPERIQQAVWNLLSNAVKFTDPGGRIRVAINQVGSSMALSVSDTGKGIDPAFLPFVFDRFRQADATITRRVGGLGLGLALVRHIIELHGGRVTAASEGPGKGATFTITLPVRAVMPATAPERPSSRRTDAPAPENPVSLNGVRVLVVDDEPDARDLIRAVLLEAGADVETARSAAEGFEAFKRFQPDVLVSDIGMPDEDGYAFMRRVRSVRAAQGGGIPALALTAYAREEDRMRALSAGYTTHVGKPVNPDALANAVANLAAFARR